MIHLHDLPLPIGRHFTPQAQQHVSCDIKRGEISWVLGPPGSGKTILLETLALRRPCKGSMRLLGHDVSARTPTRTLASICHRTGFLEEHPYLCNTLTARENVALPLEIDGLKRRHYLREATEMMHRFHLEAIMDQLPQSLSMLSYWQTACLRTLIRRPELLLIDASLLSAMPEFHEMLSAFLQELSSSGSTILLTARDETLVRTLPASVIHLPQHDHHHTPPSASMPSSPYVDQRREPRLS